MNVKVVYHSMTGNTKKIAEAIAGETGTVAEAISDDVDLDGVDLLFIGDGNYANDMHAKTKKLIGRLAASRIGGAAAFGTYGGFDTAMPKLKASLKNAGVAVQDESFTCTGKAWGIIQRGHPDESDLAHAREFARNAVARRAAASGK